jgi:5'-nucleotidase
VSELKLTDVGFRKAAHMKPVVSHEKTLSIFISSKHHSRREVLVGAAAGAMVVLRGKPAAAADGKKTFTILHTNDIHSNFVGMSPEADYTPFSLNDDKTGAVWRVWPP